MGSEGAGRCPEGEDREGMEKRGSREAASAKAGCGRVGVTVRSSTRESSVVGKQFWVSTVAVVTRISTCDNMAQNCTHALYQWQGPGFSIML